MTQSNPYTQCNSHQDPYRFVFFSLLLFSEALRGIFRLTQKRKPIRTARENHDKEQREQDFAGGPVVKNPPSNAGDLGSIPGGGTSIPHASGQLNSCTAITEPVRHN